MIKRATKRGLDASYAVRRMQEVSELGECSKYQLQRANSRYHIGIVKK